MAVVDDDLEFDMWDGQFEFFGNNFAGKTADKKRQNPLEDSGIYDKDVDLILTPITAEDTLSSKSRLGVSVRRMSLLEHTTNDVQMLQQQMNVLADNQNHSDERYTRAKQENAALQARILILEEQLRENELRSEEKFAEEVKRHRELVARVDREKQLQVENCAIRLQTLEQSNESLKEEASRCRCELETHRKEKERLKECLEESQQAIVSLKEEVHALREQEKRYNEEKKMAEQLLDDLSREVEILRSEKLRALSALQNCREMPSQTETELQIQLDSLKQDHRNLQEAHEELQALLLTRSIQEGRSLLTDSNNLAAELEQMTQDDHEVEAFIAEKDHKMKVALKEQQEVNAQLRAYIDNILLNIVENYPQLLEVKSNSTTNSP